MLCGDRRGLFRRCQATRVILNGKRKLKMASLMHSERLNGAKRTLNQTFAAFDPDFGLSQQKMTMTKYSLYSNVSHMP